MSNGYHAYEYHWCRISTQSPGKSSAPRKLNDTIFIGPTDTVPHAGREFRNKLPRAEAHVETERRPLMRLRTLTAVAWACVSSVLVHAEAALDVAALRDEARSMWHHAYDSYLAHAYVIARRPLPPPRSAARPPGSTHRPRLRAQVPVGRAQAAGVQRAAVGQADARDAGRLAGRVQADARGRPRRAAAAARLGALRRRAPSPAGRRRARGAGL